jgi:high-affinity iron transporter
MRNTLFLFVLLTGLLTACSASQSTQNADPSLVVTATVPPEYSGLTNPLGADAAEAGAKVFATNCASCHGEMGHGDGPVATSLTPRPVNLVTLQAASSDDYLFWRISTGRSGTAMVGWKGILADEQIWQVVAFLRTLK